jgi:hypothetical protein
MTKPFQSEEVLARVHTQMDFAMARKTLAATNAQLLALMEQLVQSEKPKSLGSLAAGVAHELNTPAGNATLTTDVIGNIAREDGHRVMPCVSLHAHHDHYRRSAFSMAAAPCRRVSNHSFKDSSKTSQDLLLTKYRNQCE